MADLLSIAAAARQLGVSPSTLRRYERQGKLLPHSRTPSGQRRYSRDDLARYDASSVAADRDRIPAQAAGAPSVQEEAAAISRTLRDLPPGAGGWVVPSVQQYAGLIQGISRFYVSPDEAIRNSRENARRMWNSLVIREPLQARNLAVAELGWEIQPQDKSDKRQKEVAQGVQRIVENIPDFLKLRQCLLNAVWFGRYGAMLKYGWSFEGGPRRLKVLEWSPIHGDSLVYKWDSDAVGIYVGIYQGYSGTKPLTTEAGIISRAHVLEDGTEVYYNDQGKPYRKLGMSERQAFVIHAHSYEAGDFLVPEQAGGVKGIGIRSTIYWTYYVMQEISGWLVDFLERVGTGITLFKFLRGDQASYNAALELAQSQSNQACVMVPVDPAVNNGKPLEGVERIEPNSVGIENMLRVLDDYFGSQVRRYIVGQDATSRPVPSGLNSGVAAAHEETFARLVRYDALNLDQTLTRDLVAVIQEWSYPGTPPCRYVSTLDKPDPKEALAAVKTAFDMGVAFDEDEVRGLTGLSKPDVDAVVLKKQEGPGGPMQDGQLPMGEEAGIEPDIFRFAAADWVRSEGPRGGTIWTSRKTGEQVHQKENPGGEARRPAAAEGPEGRGGGPQAARPEEAHRARQAKIASVFAGVAERSATLTPEQKKDAKESTARVIAAMPPKALDRLAANVKKVRFHASQQALTQSLAKEDPKLADWLRQNEARGQRLVIKGSYGRDDRSLDLDGPGTHEGRQVGSHEYAAHEMTHALDGPDHALSESPEWRDAWASEVKGNVSKYAATSPAEGLAEFGRLVYGQQLEPDELAAKFPKAAAFWRAHGLLAG